MQKTAGHILKSDEVKLEGQIKLDVCNPETNRLAGKIAGPAAQQARIIEHCPEFAVIEVVCCCGAKVYLRCEYAGGARLGGDASRSGAAGKSQAAGAD